MPIVPCPFCNNPVSDAAYRCPHCEEVIEGKFKCVDDDPDIFISSTEEIVGYEIAECIGFVSAQSAFGLGMFSSMEANLADITGTEAGGLGGKLQKAKDDSMLKLRMEARDSGANAVVSAKLEVSSIGSITVVLAQGTAVVISKK